MLYHVRMDVHAPHGMATCGAAFGNEDPLTSETPWISRLSISNSSASSFCYS